MTLPRLNGQSVLVTGGAGFVGSHIADGLVDTNDVRIIDDLSAGSLSNIPPGTRLFEGDVRNRDLLLEAMDGVDVVFHQAGLVSVEKSIEHPDQSHGRNADATVAVLEAARQEDARVVLASSAAIYGPPEDVPVGETAPKTPTSPYGADKLFADHYARVYNDRYDLSTVVLRYFNAYGPRQSGDEYGGVISTFVDQARAGAPLTVHGDGTQTRDFVHVRDVVRANLLAARTSAVGRAFNVGTGTPVSIRELVEVVREYADTDPPVVSTDGRDADIERSCADISRARKRLGYRPEVSLSDGVRTVFDAHG